MKHLSIFLTITVLLIALMSCNRDDAATDPPPAPRRAPPAQAADPKETPTSSGTSTPQTINDCFGEALSEDPIHCSVLQLAHNEGIMEVDAVYRAGSSLYLYLAQSERVSDEVYDYIRSKAREEVARRGGRACTYGISGCDIGVLRSGLLPVSAVYSEIELRTGGADGRRSHGGWAAYRQLWPVVSSDGTRGGSSGTTAASSFDVSDVDTKNFPEFQSRWHEPLKGLGLAGWHWGGDKAYVQVKAPPGQEANATAAKEAVIRQNRRLNDDNVVIIPVKYDYEEYWRWSVILDRFAVSSGNTIGILWSRVRENWESYHTTGGEAVYPLPEVPETVLRPELGGVAHPEDYRTTLHVMTYELQRTVDALPVLLPLLGIPVDAVGVVIESKPKPFAITVIWKPQPGLLAPPSPAQAADPKETPTSSGTSTPQTINDCFGGALSEDPIHCSVLQLAHNEGIMEVDAVYRAGSSLYLYLAQSERVSNEVYDYIRSKAREEVARRGGRACTYGISGCDIGVLGEGLLPVSEVYSDIELRTGGADGRRSHGGWAAYRQLWPVVSGGTRGVSSGTTAASTFDVSGVDTTNFPELTCTWEQLGSHDGDCGVWKRDGLGIAGAHRVGDKTYYQVKAPPGQEANVAAAREELHRRYPKYADDAIVIIPVKYDYEELWRWSVILDRFGVSSGNTIGILGGRVHENWEAYDGGEAVYPLSEVPEAVRRPELGGVRHPGDLRTTLHVMTYELHRTVDALPVLLPLLGIPVDAVGVVIESKPKPFAITVTLPGVSSSVRPAPPIAVPEATESGGDETVAVTESASDSGDEGTPTVSRPDAAVSESVSEEGGDDAAPVASAPAEPVISEATESVSEGESAPAPAVAEPAVK